MFPHAFSLVCMVVGIVLMVGAGRSWLNAPYWSLIGIALTDISFISLVPYYVAKHSRPWVVFYSFGCVIITVDAIRKFNTLKAKQQT